MFLRGPRGGIEDIYELNYIRKDGSRFAAVVSVTALRDVQDAVIGYLLIGTDNTARMRAEEARRMSEARIGGIVNSAMDAIISIDSGHAASCCSNAAAEKDVPLHHRGGIGAADRQLHP